MYYSLAGKWKVTLPDGNSNVAEIPGTLDTNAIGHADRPDTTYHPDSDLGNKASEEVEEKIATRFRRKHTFEGPAQFVYRCDFLPEKNKRVFLEVERARCLTLFVDGKEIRPFAPSSLSTPNLFEITGLLTGDNELVLVSDNSYPGLPYDGIIQSSAATDNTQTNWNGLIGKVGIVCLNQTFIKALRAYPHQSKLSVQLDIVTTSDFEGVLNLHSSALVSDFTTKVKLKAGIHTLSFSDIPLSDQALRWDEYEGHLYELSADLGDIANISINFGIRTIASDDFGRLTLNGRRIFLRSETNCAVFPETGHPPMDVNSWLDMLTILQNYGVNMVRFHSWCPPEAAFVAADQLGILMQPELSYWDPQNAFSSKESKQYYRQELEQILNHYANHPSFVMLTFGNELFADHNGHEEMTNLLNHARQIDPTRLFANGSNVHYGREGSDTASDFYTSGNFYHHKLRGAFAGNKNENQEPGRVGGYINQQYPNTLTDYTTTMDALLKEYQKPVFSFEVGQFEVLPDFDEIQDFHGVTIPENYQLIQEKVQKKGLMPTWKQRVAATGELSLLAYREEVEAVLRTESMSGISLLSLQDFPGQGTALVGMLNAHLEAKPFKFALAERFQSFFKDQLPLVLLPKYTYTSNEELIAEVKIANYGKNDLVGILTFELRNGKEIVGKGSIGSTEKITCPKGTLSNISTLKIKLADYKVATRLDLRIMLDNSETTYPIWVYPEVVTDLPDNIYEARSLDAQAVEVLNNGGTVYFAPDATKEAMPSSVVTQFTTDFWSVGTFPSQSGTMGQLIDADHPLFDRFPTETHSNWQWWAMASQRAFKLPDNYPAIITEMDSYAYLRPLAKLIEFRCGEGRILLSSMGLHNLQKYPEAAYLQAEIYRYLSSENFNPQTEIDLKTLVQICGK